MCDGENIFPFAKHLINFPTHFLNSSMFPAAANFLARINFPNPHMIAYVAMSGVDLICEQNSAQV